MLSLITNTSALGAQRNLAQTNNRLSNSLEKLSSGLRVSKASDDVASMAIGSRLETSIASLSAAAVNTGQAVSMLQIAEGMYERVQDMLVRIKSLSAQAANGTLSDTERALLTVEYQGLQQEVNRLAQDTKFNGQTLSYDDTASYGNGSGGHSLLAVGVGHFPAPTGFNPIRVTAPDGTYNVGDDAIFEVTINGHLYQGTMPASQIDGTGRVIDRNSVELSSDTSRGKIRILFNNDGVPLADGATVSFFFSNGSGPETHDFRVGAGTGPESTISTDLYGISMNKLGLFTGLTISNEASADFVSSIVDTSLDYLLQLRSELGATQNRLANTQVNISTRIENEQAAKAAYLDADIGSEITKFTSEQILLQSGISTLAQANQLPQQLLSLFQ